MKFSRAISRIKWLSGEKPNVSKTISVLVLRVLTDWYPEDEVRDGLRNVDLLTAQPFDPADSPRELHHNLSLGYDVPVSLHDESFPFVLCRKLTKRSVHMHYNELIRTEIKFASYLL
jgi:hypothetical protein